MGSQNAPIGDQSIDQLPQTQVLPEDLEREKKMASFSKSDEFKALKMAINSRIEYYQRYMPGTDVQIASLPNEERGYMWLASSVIIDEFRSIIQAYEQAAEAVTDANGTS